MRYILLIILAAHLCVAIYLSGFELVSVAWFTAPVIISLAVEILYLLGKTESRALAVIGAIVLTLAIPVYLSELTYTGSDAQAGLLVGLMPIYQLVALFITSVVLGVKSIFSGTTKST